MNTIILSVVLDINIVIIEKFIIFFLPPSLNRFLVINRSVSCTKVNPFAAKTSVNIGHMISPPF